MLFTAKLAVDMADSLTPVIQTNEANDDQGKWVDEEEEEEEESSSTQSSGTGISANSLSNRCFFSKRVRLSPKQFALLGNLIQKHQLHTCSPLVSWDALLAEFLSQRSAPGGPDDSGKISVHLLKHKYQEFMRRVRGKYVINGRLLPLDSNASEGCQVFYKLLSEQLDIPGSSLSTVKPIESQNLIKSAKSTIQGRGKPNSLDFNGWMAFLQAITKYKAHLYISLKRWELVEKELNADPRFLRYVPFSADTLKKRFTRGVDIIRERYKSGYALMPIRSSADASEKLLYTLVQEMITSSLAQSEDLEDNEVAAEEPGHARIEPYLDGNDSVDDNNKLQQSDGEALLIVEDSTKSVQGNPRPRASSSSSFTPQAQEEFLKLVYELKCHVNKSSKNRWDQMIAALATHPLLSSYKKVTAATLRLRFHRLKGKILRKYGLNPNEHDLSILESSEDGRERWLWRILLDENAAAGLSSRSQPRVLPPQFKRSTPSRVLATEIDDHSITSSSSSLSSLSSEDEGSESEERGTAVEEDCNALVVPSSRFTKWLPSSIVLPTKTSSTMSKQPETKDSTPKVTVTADDDQSPETIIKRPAPIADAMETGGESGKRVRKEGTVLLQPAKPFDADSFFASAIHSLGTAGLTADAETIRERAKIISQLAAIQLQQLKNAEMELQLEQERERTKQKSLDLQILQVQLRLHHHNNQ